MIMPIEYEQRTVRSSREISDWEDYDNTDDINEVKEQLLKYIHDNNTEAFSTRFKNKFIHSYSGETRVYHSNDGRWDAVEHKEYHLSLTTQPLIEVLFSRHPDVLLAIVDALLLAGNDALFAALIASVNQTSVTDRMLFTGTDSMREQVITRIDEMDSHGDELVKQNDNDAINKGNVIKTQCSVIRDELSRFPREAKGESKISEVSTITPQNKIKNLKFKLQFLKKLHQADEELYRHRGNTKLFFSHVGNALFGLGTVGIGLLVCRAWTYYFSETGARFGLFNTNTTTENHVKRMNHALGVNPHFRYRMTK
jgi:hypothetical protein